MLLRQSCKPFVHFQTIFAPSPFAPFKSLQVRFCKRMKACFPIFTKAFRDAIVEAAPHAAWRVTPHKWRELRYSGGRNSWSGRKESGAGKSMTGNAVIGLLDRPVRITAG